MNEIIEYIPQLEIECYDGKKIYINEAPNEKLLKSLDQRFVEFNGVILNTREIKSIQKAKVSKDYKDLPVEMREKIDLKKISHRNSMGRTPTKEHIDLWVSILKSGNELTY